MTDIAVYEPKTGMNLLFQIKKQQVILTASACLIALAIVLKNVLFVPYEILQRDMLIYIILYLGFLVIAFMPDGDYDKSSIPTFVWDLLIIGITLGIIAAYTF